MADKIEIRDLTTKTVIQVTDMDKAHRKLASKVALGIDQESEKLVNNTEVIKANLRDKTTAVILDPSEINSLDFNLNEIIDAASKLKALLEIAKEADIEL